jgi:O-antigen ligase/polysaccharide polymerase Wzy-like membrane protein
MALQNETAVTADRPLIRFLDRTILLVFVLLIFGVVLGMYRHTTDAVNIKFYITTILVSVIIAILAVRMVECRLKPTWGTAGWLVLAYLGWNIIGAIYARYSIYATRELWQVGSSTLVFCLAMVYFRSDNEIKPVFHAILFATLLSCAYSVMQRFGVDFTDWEGGWVYGKRRYFGTMGHPGFFSGFLIQIVPVFAVWCVLGFLGRLPRLEKADSEVEPVFFIWGIWVLLSASFFCALLATNRPVFLILLLVTLAVGALIPHLKITPPYLITAFCLTVITGFIYLVDALFADPTKGYREEIGFTLQGFGLAVTVFIVFIIIKAIYGSQRSLSPVSLGISVLILPGITTIFALIYRPLYYWFFLVTALICMSALVGPLIMRRFDYGDRLAGISAGLCLAIFTFSLEPAGKTAMALKWVWIVILLAWAGLAAFEIIKSKVTAVLPKGLYVIFGGVVLYGYYLTFSRASFIGLAGALFLAAGLSLVFVPQRKKVLAGLVTALVICAVMIPIFARNTYLWERMANLKDDPSVRTRVEIYRTCWEMFSERPVFGFGLGNFPATYQNYQSPEYARLAPSRIFLLDYAHSELFQVAIELGLVGLFILLAALTAIYLAGLSRMRLTRNPANIWLMLAIFTGHIGVFAQNLIDVNMRYPFTSVFYWLMLAVWIRWILLDDTPEGITDEAGGES